MDNKQKRVATIRGLISKWHILRQKAVPLDHLIYAMANEIVDLTNEIPADKLYECWMQAKSVSDFMPTEANLLKAWRETINKAVHVPNSRIEYKPTHECEMCKVVSARLSFIGFGICDASESISNKPITKEEVDCVRSSICRDKTTLDYWNESPKSPYRGMLI